MSILPNQTVDINTVIESTTQSDNLPIPKEYGWDFEKNEFILKDGKFIVVEGNEAIKIWIWKVLNTPRYRYLAYTLNYGNQIEELIEKSLSRSVIESEAKRYVEEALSINPYIQEIESFSIEFEGSRAVINFTAKTLYGEVDISV
ncbi:DUF2634 domain-containing protein [Clostridium sp. AWRP]|uniref:DUF2634 domain-containing protein n=1 Tax=Clostridium sp. AWRP TaxID=2212991 RepID=UPI000FDC04B5|nr:DUF2634 domain-containing protein [Clostridium sp. AWRP]AZV57920.1 DUF2634 domain-containing protein [Clostridium sp. AWRP]